MHSKEWKRNSENPPGGANNVGPMRLKRPHGNARPSVNRFRAKRILVAEIAGTHPVSLAERRRIWRTEEYREGVERIERRYPDTW